MSLLGSLFGEKHTESLALLDIHAGSIGGAYVILTKGQVPRVIHSTRCPIEAHDGEPPEAAMERTFSVVGANLVREGAPKLLRATTTGTADVVLCAISAPWQETLVRREHIEEKSAFTFTKNTLQKALEKEGVVSPGRMLVNEFAVGTVLNGYETADPIGKRASRATIIILTSSVDKTIAEVAAKTLRSLFHTKDIVLASGAAVRYQALRSIFPHERDALILDAEGNEVTFSLVRHGLLVAVSQVAIDMTKDPEAWNKTVQAALSEVAKEYPLPHTIFLLSQEGERDLFKKNLENGGFGSLWLSDDQPLVTAIMPSHLSAFIKLEGETAPDLALMQMALYANSIFIKE